ncbi:hypothetical protein [Tsukamurella pseudospumae]|uniref:Uncharacterized protein n=1 Tax=Tsukamurella pseudospumae TaxID=239498 RepID=A0A138AUA5_9ACTN|nr:hypothetical protein [Tsukamurella pseudospumae]KXO98952.1 hypothetical protein AXK61_18590 [Tsukamurella pseudospumae]KXP14028.1 hypothetical protein AXK60_22500 [Tsukamurella pseudospumae]
MNIFARPLVRTGLIAALALVIGVLLALTFTPQRSAGVPPPATLEQRSVDSVCSQVITGFGGEVWATPLGESQLRRVDRDQLGVTGCRTDPSR